MCLHAVCFCRLYVVFYCCRLDFLVLGLVVVVCIISLLSLLISPLDPKNVNMQQYNSSKGEKTPLLLLTRENEKDENNDSEQVMTTPKDTVC
jgi:hypothetical protein